jgi:hypothetical protein
MNEKNLPTIRLGLQVDETDDSSRISCGLFSVAEAELLQKLLPRFDLTTVDGEVFPPETILYDVEVSNDKGGTLQDLRTEEEVLGLLQEIGRLSNHEAKLLFEKCRLKTDQALDLLKKGNLGVHLVAENPEKKVTLTIYQITLVRSTATGTAADPLSPAILPHERVEAIRNQLTEARTALAQLRVEDKLWENWLSPAEGGITCVLAATYNASQEMKKHHEKWGQKSEGQGNQG